jgi:hypothetical protein
MLGLYENIPSRVREQMARGVPPLSPWAFWLRFGGLVLLYVGLSLAGVMERSAVRATTAESREVKQ